MTHPAFASAITPEFTSPTSEAVPLHFSRVEIGASLSSICVDDVIEAPQQSKLEAIEEIFGAPASIPTSVRYEHCTKQPFAFTPVSGYRSAAEAVHDLGISLDELAAAVTALNVPNYMLAYDKDEGLLLAPKLDVVIADELEWRDRFAEADSFVTATQLAELVGGFDNDRISLTDFIAKTKIDYLEDPQGEHTYPKVFAHWLRAETMLAAQTLGVDPGISTDNFDTVMVDEILRSATMRPGHCKPRPDGRLLFEELTVLVGTTRDIARTVLSQLDLGAKDVTELPSTSRGGRKAAGFTPDVAVPLAYGVVEHWSERIDELQQTLRELGAARAQGASTLTLRQCNATKLLLAKAQGKHDEATYRLQQLLNSGEDISKNKAS